MKSLKPLFILGVLLSAQFISAQYTLTLNLQNMDAYVGHRFEVRVTEQPTGKEVGRKTIASLESNSPSLLLYVFLQGRSYNVDFYADVNSNGVYDAPPTDHAWRRVIVNASADKVVDFSPDENYIDIGFPDAFQYSQYNAVWGGKWKNLTFGSTDSIKASFQLRCDSVFGMFMTKGVFGNPAPVTFNYAGAVPPDTASSDTIRYTIPAPWTGEVIVVNGDIMGNISLAGTGLVFNGTLGEKQILCVYTVVIGGNPFANGYFYVRELSIINSAPTLKLSYLQIDPTCSGDCNGLVDLMVTGGTPAYTFAWFNGLGSEDYPNACGGPGDVTVFDDDGCSATASFILNEPAPIEIQTEVMNPSCPGACDGDFFVQASGGVPPFTYEISGGSPGHFCAGQYTVIVTDAGGCSVVDTVFLTDPAPVQFENILVTHPTEGQNNGSIEIVASGGTPPLIYSINGGPPQASNIFTSLPPGMFEVCVQDASGCMTCSDSIVLEEMVAVQDLDYSFSFYPNPVTNELHIHSDIPHSVDLLDTNGELLFNDSQKNDHQIKMVDYPQGIYFLKISDGEKYAFRKIVKAGG